VIAEFKRKSPSRGSIGEPELADQVRRYESAGASAISILTEPARFGGSYADLTRAAEAVSVPLLMKDFVVDPRQVGEAARLGASAVLLILRCLSDSDVDELVSACAAHGVTPLVECHRESEIERALSHPGSVLGVNNRDLETLQIDRRIAPRLLAGVPADRVVVAESGYETAREAHEVRGLADAVLVGSALMRRPDPETLIREIRG
jgi:indole-3-glycerol phosphate synthase